MWTGDWRDVAEFLRQPGGGVGSVVEPVGEVGIAAVTVGDVLEGVSCSPGDRFPTLVTLGPQIWRDNRDERFTTGLDVLVDGLRRRTTP